MRKGTTKTGNPEKSGKAIRFQLIMEQGHDVYVAGTFNNWDSRSQLLKYEPEAGSYRATLRIPPGRHEYKFIVNGKWRLDPKCPETVPNLLGDANNVITV